MQQHSSSIALHASGACLMSHSQEYHMWAGVPHTIAFEMSEPYTSAPWSARGMESDPVPQPAQAPMNSEHLVCREASSM